MRLAGKTAIITGGASGIGYAAVKRFLSEGAKVVIADYNEAAGSQALQQLEVDDEERVLFIQVDVSNPESVERMIEAVVSTFGGIDILINNAGITQDAMLTKMSIDQWKSVIGVNLNGVFYCTRFAAPYMVQQGKGKIINTSSIVGVQGNIGQTNYAATKAGVIGMTKTWARELGFKGICVNAVAPGYIHTSMVDKVPEKVLEKMVEKVPLRRLGTPEEIANAYLFLASDESDYINGATIEINGGLSI
ncbi:3-oxoacyl-ACP reductase [Paenibacillus selenitireducens]|uniref:3-oxoacyl-ACP reductase n=1 Tax=Paenibacillus selenitireducens TaxID=1324314 RepID=A0A1T2XJW5_9BACL|nr:3-oxoacyl-ACP reductase FabG [Paenibacillus selenitireducens]OPA80112.1 3-oxoacyl-ACP reductase [Paenibacillus selenitireducens]